MNYKLLLRKYIEYIIEVEGSNFITYYSHKDILARSKFTKEECERLQTVPDNYTDCVSDSQRYQMLGNGWTVDVIAEIFRYLNSAKTK